MTSWDLLAIAKEGPLSSVFFHFTVIIRALPFASHGLVKEPVPVEPAGQSWGGSGVVEGAGAGALSSFEQLARARIARAGTSALCIGRILVSRVRDSSPKYDEPRTLGIRSPFPTRMRRGQAPRRHLTRRSRRRTRGRSPS